MLACDLVVASATASFGLPEVKRGLVPTSGGLFRTARALPLNVTKEMLLTGENLSPGARVCPRPGERASPNRVRQLREAMGLAARICAVGPVAVRASLHALARAS